MSDESARPLGTCSDYRTSYPISAAGQASAHANETTLSGMYSTYRDPYD